MGFTRRKCSGAPPNSSACSGGRKENVIASTKSRDASARRTVSARRCAGSSDGLGNTPSRWSGTAGILS